MASKGRKEQVPTVRSRRLAAILREKREASGLSATVAAEKAYLAASWVYRAEMPNCRPNPNNVAAILRVYGITDEDEIRRVVGLARDAARPGWWDSYELTSDHAEFVAAEAEASVKLVWEPSLIPGLLQVPAYAREVIASGPEKLTPGRIGELVRVRMERQRVLTRDDPLRLTVIIDEPVLRRVVGTRALMREQLWHLAEVAEQGPAVVRVLPEETGAHPAMRGPFTILRYADPATDHDVVYCETVAGALYAETVEVADRARSAFSHLETLALGRRDSMEKVASYAADL